MKAYNEYPVVEYKNFREMLDGCVAQYETRPLFREKAGDGIQDTSSEAFLRLVNRLGAVFLALGLLDGGKIAVVGETSVKWVATYFATVCGGGVIVPVDKDLPVDEMAYILNDSEAQAIIYSPSTYEEMKKLEQIAPGLQYFIGMETPAENQKWLSFDTLVAEVTDSSVSDYLAIPQNSDVLSTILYTSGTTGQSKGVMLCQRNILSAAIGGLKLFQVGKTSMSILPIHHVFEMTHGIVEMIINGTTICISDSLRYFLPNLQLFKPEAMFVVPAYVEMMYKKIWASVQAEGKEEQFKELIQHSNELLAQGKDQRAELFQFIRDAFGGKLSMLLCAGAPLDAMYVKFFREIGILLLQGFGLTETSPLVTANRNEYIVDASTGAPIYCCEVKIWEPNENGEGEILVKGDNIMLGYYKNEQATREVFTDDWFHTGDMGRIDDAGLLYITGRKKNVIILSNGKNIYPEEIEGYYLHIPYLKEVVVYAPTSGENQNQLCAEVFLDEAFREQSGDANALKALHEDIANINKTLPGYKQVHNIILRDTMFEKTTKKSIKRHAINSGK